MDTMQLLTAPGCARKLCWEGFSENQGLFRNSGGFKLDVTGAVVTVYEMITQDTQLAEQVLMGAIISTVEGKEWARRPDVNLEKEIIPYLQTFRSWLGTVKGSRELKHPLQAGSGVSGRSPDDATSRSRVDKHGNPAREASPCSSVLRDALNWSPGPPQQDPRWLPRACEQDLGSADRFPTS